MVIEYRWADGRYDRLPALAAELVRLQPDVIITSGPGTRVMKEASKFALVFNLKTAKAMGLRIQQSLILRADHVID
jgi:hypothetical protein